MEGTEKQDLIFLELRQRLQRGLLIIRSDAAEDRAMVNVTSGDSAIEIRIPDGGYKVELKPGVSVVEGSWQKSPELNADGLHVRFRLRVDQPSEPSDSAAVQLRTQEKYEFLCQSCRATLLTEKVFRRVLPLPNGNWNALVDDWCCHPDPFANRKLLPREEDCLLGDTYFLLTRDSSCDPSLTQVDSSCVNLGTNQHSGKQTDGRKNTVLLCKKCSAVLGEAVTTEVLKLYRTEVVIKPSEDVEFTLPEHRQRFLERALASRLLELSSSQSIFRFSIQTPDGKSVIMLWLLNTDTLIASFSEKVPGSNGPISSSDRHLAEHPSRQAASAVKVLYLPCARGQHQEAVEAWEKDISVHALALPRSTCDEVLQLLRSCTSTLPLSLRSMNSFQVAYLKR